MKRLYYMQWTRLWSLLGIVTIILFPFGHSVYSEDANSENNKSYSSVEDYQHYGICGTPPPSHEDLFALEAVGDCSSSQSQNLVNYDTTYVYQIPVWVHIITNNDGTIGDISDSMVESQIEVLNEDFRALAGTPGAKGTDVRVEFYLAGKERTANTEWFNSRLFIDGDPDKGIDKENEAYKHALKKDPRLYLNIYTKTWSDAPTVMGYSSLPYDDAGKPRDGVVINWRNFGRNSPAGPPYDQGRTTTHEVGHYLGLWHTFQDRCSAGTVGGFCNKDQDCDTSVGAGDGICDQCGADATPNCYSEGDNICDTNPEAAFNLGCPNPVNASCGSLEDPIHNYMNYTDHTCMEEFTVEQAQRIICTIDNYRSDSCSQFDSSTGMPPVGFGAAYNVLSPDEELLIQVLCGFSHATVNAGSGKSNQFIWRQGYIWRNAQWEPYNLTGDDLRDDNWYLGNANATISVSPAELQGVNWIIAYICTWTGTQWKCGCRDENCTNSYWQLQKFGVESEAESYTTKDLNFLAQEDMPPPPPTPHYRRLVYTPVTPYRIVDTRKAGTVSPSKIRSYDVWGAVASQGGNSAGWSLK